MTAQEKSRQIVEELQSIPDQEERFLHVMAKGKKAPGLPEEKKTDKFKIEGCASQLWLVPDFHDGRCYFAADSDAFITKGVSSILAHVYSDATPDEVLALDPDFLREGGITQHLSPNRANGLSAVCKQIKLYAIAFKQLGGDALKGLG
ncbi:MAG: SufE family protein [Verrucomicrobiota bacterium]